METVRKLTSVWRNFCVICGHEEDLHDEAGCAHEGCNCPAIPNEVPK